MKLFPLKPEVQESTLLSFQLHVLQKTEYYRSNTVTAIIEIVQKKTAWYGYIAV